LRKINTSSQRSLKGIGTRSRTQLLAASPQKPVPVQEEDISEDDEQSHVKPSRVAFQL
jgi:hypothetical protein